MLGRIVHDLALLEKEVARYSYSMARESGGKLESDLLRTLAGGKANELVGLYVGAGLAAGHKEALELVRRLESWARSEAVKRIPKSPL
jgi:hypothetical protein